MIQGNHKVFLDRNKLILLANLRIVGYSTVSLANLFGVDRSSIYAQLKKYNIIPLEPVFNIERIVAATLPQITPKFESNWIVVAGERINIGWNYKDYLAQAHIPITKSLKR